MLYFDDTTQRVGQFAQKAEPVARWRRAQALERTRRRRPDLIAARGGLSADDLRLLAEHGYPDDSPGTAEEPSAP